MSVPYLPPALRFDVCASDIPTHTQAIIDQSTAVLDAVAAARGAGTVDWEHVIAPLIALDRDMDAKSSALTFLKNVSTEKAVRDAAAAAAAALSAFEVRAGMRVDVYESVRAYADTLTEASGLDAEARRFIEHTLRDYRRRGLHLPEATRREIEAVKTEISDLCVQFQQTLAEVDTKLYFTRDELRGMPEDFVEGLKSVDAATAGRADGGDTFYEVTLSYPHVVPLLKLAAIPATRAAVEKAFNSRAHPANTALLERVVALRQKAAALLGYPSHAAFVLEEKMANTVETVEKFLGDLLRDLRRLADADIQSLAALKRAEEGDDSGPITMADYRYYMEKELRDKYSVDHGRIKEYFPMQTVVARMLKTYETILSVRFTECAGEDVTAHVWHPDVKLFAVKDAAAGSDGAVLGYFYLDMYPRTGKYSHAAVFPLVSGCELGAPSPRAPASVERVVPVCAMVCNFPKPTETTPSLLRHEEVVTLFHEFGHVCHHILSHTRFVRFASFRCEQDFVEAPSQMLENWCWVPSTLQQLSGHYKDESQVLPLELAEKLAASRIAHAGLTNVRQVFLASFDMRLHSLPAQLDASPDSIKAVDVIRELHDTILRIPMTPGTSFGASFGHLAGGYDAQYYGYLWSEVYAADMFESAFKAAPLDPAPGLRYRRGILARGGSEDAKDFLRAFLGREPSTAAFLRQKGLA